MGERSSRFVELRAIEKRRWNSRINHLWLRHYPLVARFYREVRGSAPVVMTVVALVEDGMFEQEIPISVSLFAESMWNPFQPDAKILQTAMSPYHAEMGDKP